MPTLYEAAILTSQAGSHPREIPDGWVRLTDSTKELTEAVVKAEGLEFDLLGYYGVAFVNHAKKEIVIAHRGTKFVPKLREGALVFSKETKVVSCNLISDSVIAMQGNPNESRLAHAFSSCVLRWRTENGHADYVVTQVGHSLGAFHAHLSGYQCPKAVEVRVIGFDGPGAEESIKYTVKPTDADDLDDDKFEKRRAYHLSVQSLPNAVNTANTQYGRVYQLNMEDEARSTRGISYVDSLVNHRLAHLIDRIPVDSVSPFESMPACFQDVSTIWNVGVVEVKRDGMPATGAGAAATVGGAGAETPSESYCISPINGYRLTKEKWQVSHLNLGSVFTGHSMLIVEGVALRRGDDGAAVECAFVGHYHLTVNMAVQPTEAEREELARHHDRNVLKEAEGFAQIKVTQNALGLHPYRRLYRGWQSTSWECTQQQAVSMITNILENDVGKWIPYQQLQWKWRDGQSHNCTTWAASVLPYADIELPTGIGLKEKPVLLSGAGNFLAVTGSSGPATGSGVAEEEPHVGSSGGRWCVIL